MLVRWAVGRGSPKDRLGGTALPAPRLCVCRDICQPQAAELLPPA